MEPAAACAARACRGARDRGAVRVLELERGLRVQGNAGDGNRLGPGGDHQPRGEGGAGEERRWIDPFDGGQIRFEDQAQELLDREFGGSVRVQDAFLREASKRDMLVRMLMNLRDLYLNGGDNTRASSAAERLKVLRSSFG